MAMPSTHASANTASRWRAKTMLSPSLLATNCHSGRVSRSMRCASSSHSIASSGGMPKQRNSTTLSTAIRASMSASGRSPTWSPSSQTSGKLAGGSGSPKRSSSSRLAFRISWGSGAGTLTPSDSIALLPVAAREVGTERGQAYRHVLGTLVGRRRVPDPLPGPGHDRLPGGALDDPVRRLDRDPAAQHERVLVELRRLELLGPAGRRDHVCHGDVGVAGVDAPHVLVDDLPARHRHPGRLLDQSRHQAILSSTRERFSGAASATTTAPPAAAIAAGILPASSVRASKSVSPRRTGSPGRLCSTIPAAALTGSSLRARPAPRRHAATPSI